MEPCLERGGLRGTKVTCKINRFSLIPIPHLVWVCILLHCVIMKAILAGVGLRSGIEIENVLAIRGKKVSMLISTHFEGQWAWSINTQV